MSSFEGMQFNNWEVLKELGSGKVLCRCSCGTEKVVDKYSVKKGKSTSCGCSKEYKKIKGNTYGYWEVLDDIDSTYALCRCICGSIKEVQKAHLKNGTSKSCGCKQGTLRTNNLENTTINYLTIIKELGDGRIVAKCQCGKEFETSKYAVTSEKTKSCGCMSAKIRSKSLLNNLEGKTINEWTILKELGNGYVKCQCSCGEINNFYKKSMIVRGYSKSCGHNTNKFRDLTNKVIGNWTVLEELGYGRVLCKCKCNNQKVITKATLLNNTSKSCGCMKDKELKHTLIERYGETTARRIHTPREKYQIDAIESKDSLIKFITNTYSSYKPTLLELKDSLNISISYIGKLIKSYELQDYVNIKPLYSRYEKEILEYISSIYSGKIETRVRNKLGNTQELDIYIPEKRLAIEFNGNYWHSNIHKENRYHQNKTMLAAKNRIRLIHIFEYEWSNLDLQLKIKSLLSGVLLNNKNIMGAREFNVKSVSYKEASDFLSKYHLQGSTSSKNNLALVKDNEIYGLISFGKPRFNQEFDIELHRLCFKDSVHIIGGTEKLFKHLRDNHKNNSILTYVDISKFTGNVYTRLGFKLSSQCLTNPNYCWVSICDNSVLSRYKTQKHKLIELGLGTKDQTEDEIMENLGYIKIYDSGNLKLQMIL